MHPNGAFAWTDEQDMLSFVAEQSFGHIFTASQERLFVVHAPLLVIGGRIQFHVSRRNRIAEALAVQPVLISVAGRQGYQSANWYVSENQVPTWHYEAVEIEGIPRELTANELIVQLDALSEIHERRVHPDRPWTRAKMDPAKFDAMIKVIIGFEVEPTAIRGTRKFNQHKGALDIDAARAGQAGAGRIDIVEAIDELTKRP